MKIYEWDVEELEPYDEESDSQDIIDHNHDNNLKDIISLRNEFKHSALVLVLDIYDRDEGLQDRYWAYVKNGNLPRYFESSDHKIPKRFHKELKINQP